VDTATGALVLSAVLGLLVRGEGSLPGLILSNYFGRFAFGRIAGLRASFQLVGLGLGPVIASAVYDISHSYAAIYGLIAAGYIGSAGLYLLARPPSLPTDAAAGAA
jgi:sugar phosphate permease